MFSVAWTVFLIYTIGSFAWFGQSWLRHPSRWHIGLMSFSYVAMVITVLMLHYGMVLPGMIVSGVGALSGVIGLGIYWTRYK